MALHSTRWLALGYFTYFFSYGIFLPFWSVWLSGLGLMPETIGMLLGAGLVSRFLGSLLIAPRVSDPSRLISSLRILALLTLLFALAFWMGHQVAWLMVIIVGFNLFFSPLVPLTDALANTWQKQITMDYGRVRLWGSIAFVIGSALTGKLVSLYDYRMILVMLSVGIASMLLGMLLTLFEERLTRPSHLPLHGLETLQEALSELRVAQLAERCGIAESTLRQLARDFAAAERAVCYGRMGVSTQVFGSLCQWLIQLLNLLTGNLDRVGGALCTQPALDLVGMTSGGHFNRWQSRVSGLPEYAGELPVAALAEEILSPGDGQVRALVCVAGNPVLSTPNGRQLQKALQGLDFMLAVDLYINETTCHADLILPPTAPLEHDHYDTTFNALAVRNVTRFNEAVLDKPAGALHDWEIFIGLAQAFAARNGLTLKSTLAPELMIDMGLRNGPYGACSPWQLSLARLREQPHGIDLGALQANLAARLKTPHGQVQLAPPLLLAELRRFLLEPRLPAEQLLLIGRRHVRSNNSWMHNYWRLVKGKPRHQLHMHPQDLASRGLQDGQQVRVRSRVGALEVEVQASEALMPGVVSLPHGWGHARRGGQLAIAGAQPGVSANDLTDECLRDGLSGNAALNGVPVEVEGL